VTYEEQAGRPRKVVGPVAARERRMPTAHDLLLLNCPSMLRPSLHGADRLPPWARAELRASPWVTVSRAPAVVGPGGEPWIPVTLRGHRREEWLSGYVPRSAVAVALRPEQLPDRWEELAAGRRSSVPALAALPEVRELMGGYRLIWGPIGAVGAELATGKPTTGPDSALRLLLRAPMPFSRREALLLRRKLRKLAVPVDAELETRHGAVSLAEYSTSPEVLTLHTADGPLVVADPWHPQAA